jgi:sulfite exporter TauE/SafE
MCGPLALALPVHHLPRVQQVTAILLYNLGRVFTYAFMGALFGWLGRSIYIAGFQQWFSITLGCMILVIVFLGTGFTPAWLRRYHGKVQQWMGRLLSSPRMSHYALLGMANGLLPCGMVYLAIAGALSATNVEQSVVFMIAFGSGTLPAMLVLSLFGVHIKLSVRQQLKKAVPYVVACMGILLILRGMNLGIPFVSPVMAGAPQAVISCH